MGQQADSSCMPRRIEPRNIERVSFAALHINMYYLQLIYSAGRASGLAPSAGASQGLHAQADRPVGLQLHDHLVGRGRPLLFCRIVHAIRNFQPVSPNDVVADVGKPPAGKLAKLRPDVLFRQGAALPHQVADRAQPADDGGISADRRRRLAPQHIAAHGPPLGQDFRDGRRKLTGLSQTGAQLCALFLRQPGGQAGPQHVYELRIHIHPPAEA